MLRLATPSLALYKPPLNLVLGVLQNVFRYSALLSISVIISIGHTYAQSPFEDHRLKVFPIDSIPDQQFFLNPLFVSVKGDGIRITEEPVSQNVTRLAAGGFDYVGTNNGEWGGSLVAKIGHTEHEVLQGNIVHLELIDNSLYVIEGLAHLGLSGGSIHVVEDVSDPKRTRLLTKLPDAPRLAFVDQSRSDFNRIIVVGYSSLMAIDPYENLKILYWDAFWSFRFDPTSIARYKDSYIIGLPFGVAVVPAPWGPSSRHCKDDSKYRPANSCSRVTFLATPEFHEKI